MEGKGVGSPLGNADGMNVGFAVGVTVGRLDGPTVGRAVGLMGLLEGRLVGLAEILRHKRTMNKMQIRAQLK